MIENNLAVKGFSREVIQEDQNGKSVEQTRFNFGSEPVAIIHKDLNQQSSSSKNHIVIEGIGTDKDDYQRYSTIVREQTGSPKVDYSKLNSVWVHPNAAAAGQQSY